MLRVRALFPTLRSHKHGCSQALAHASFQRLLPAGVLGFGAHILSTALGFHPCALLPAVSTLPFPRSLKLVHCHENHLPGSENEREDSWGKCDPGQDLNKGARGEGRTLRPVTKLPWRTFFNALSKPEPTYTPRSQHELFPVASPDPTPSVLTQATLCPEALWSPVHLDRASFRLRRSLYHTILGWLKCHRAGQTVSRCLLSQ